MSLKKDLSKKTSISYMDLFTTIFPEAKTKYYDLFINLIRYKLKQYDPDYINDLYKNLEFRTKDPEKIKEIKKMPIENVYVMRYILNLLEMDLNFDVNTMYDFIDYNERGLIEQNDLSKYKSYDELTQQVSLTSLKLIDKDLEKQAYKVLENDEWLIVRPLTSSASVKYGYGSRWCTAMETDPSYFSRYSYEGILIYCINKKTGLKVAVNKNESEKLISFWNSDDMRVDSIQTGLPSDVLSVVLKEIDENGVTNFDLLKKRFGNNGDHMEPYGYYSGSKIQENTTDNGPVFGIVGTAVAVTQEDQW